MRIAHKTVTMCGFPWAGDPRKAQRVFCAYDGLLKTVPVDPCMQRRTFITTVAAAAVTATAGCVADDAGGEPTDSPTESPTDEPTPSISSQSLEPRETCEEADSASISTESMSVVVDGCIVGRNGCQEPVLDDASYDADADELTVSVTTENTSKAEACTQALVDLPYRVTVEFEGRLPETTTVVHDGANGTQQAAQAQTN